VVSNAVGAADMRIEIGSRLELAPLDTLLVATDGLTDNLLMSEVVEAIRARPLDVVAAELVELCRRRMASTGGEAPSKPDDLTFILFRLRGPRGAGRAR
jgi:serine/threonine protein phosphatase PrpC